MNKEQAVAERNIDKLIAVIDQQSHESACLRNEVEMLKHKNQLLEKGEYNDWRDVGRQLEAVVVATALAGLDPYVVQYFVDGAHFPSHINREPLYCMLSVDERKFKGDMMGSLLCNFTTETVDELWLEIQKRIEPIGKALAKVKERFLLQERYWRNFFCESWFNPEDEEE